MITGRIWIAVGLILGLLMSLGCGGEKRQPSSAGKASVFEALATRRDFNGLTREQLAGKRLYDHYCAVCHGKTGRGDGFNAFNLRNSFGITPANLAEPKAPLSLDQLRRIIVGGGPAVGKSKYMPPWGGTLDASQIDAIALYVQSFSQRTENPESLQASPSFSE